MKRMTNEYKFTNVPILAPAPEFFFTCVQIVQTSIRSMRNYFKIDSTRYSQEEIRFLTNFRFIFFSNRGNDIVH